MAATHRVYLGHQLARSLYRLPAEVRDLRVLLLGNEEKTVDQPVPELHVFLQNRVIFHELEVLQLPLVDDALVVQVVRKLRKVGGDLRDRLLRAHIACSEGGV